MTKIYTKAAYETERDAALEANPDRELCTAGYAKAYPYAAADKIVLFERCNCHELIGAYRRDVRHQPGYRPQAMPAARIEAAKSSIMVAIMENPEAKIDPELVAIANGKPKEYTPPNEPVCTHDANEWDDE